MAEFKVEHKKQLSSEHGSVSQRKGATVLPDNRGQVSQARVLTDNRTAQLAPDPMPKPNNTGLPNQLKAGIESLSGMSMDHVKVHYNSSQPAQLHAHAYAQGSNIHLAPGQEKQLPHEAWHVVQQAQGRVKPTMQMKTGVGVNDDAKLEREADVMGGKAVSVGLAQAKSIGSAPVDSPVGFKHINVKPYLGRQEKTSGAVKDSGIEMIADIFQMMIREDHSPENTKGPKGQAFVNFAETAAQLMVDDKDGSWGISMKPSFNDGRNPIQMQLMVGGSWITAARTIRKRVFANGGNHADIATLNAWANDGIMAGRVFANWGAAIAAADATGQGTNWRRVFLIFGVILLIIAIIFAPHLVSLFSGGLGNGQPPTGSQGSGGTGLVPANQLNQIRALQNNQHMGAIHEMTQHLRGRDRLEAREAFEDIKERGYGQDDVIEQIEALEPQIEAMQDIILPRQEALRALALTPPQSQTAHRNITLPSQVELSTDPRIRGNQIRELNTDYLAKNVDVIRIHTHAIAGQHGRGHQAAAVAVMEQLIRDYHGAARIEIIIEANSDAMYVFQNLIPGFNPMKDRQTLLLNRHNFTVIRHGSGIRMPIGHQSERGVAIYPAADMDFFSDEHTNITATRHAMNELGSQRLIALNPHMWYEDTPRFIDTGSQTFPITASHSTIFRGNTYRDQASGMSKIDQIVSDNILHLVTLVRDGKVDLWATYGLHFDDAVGGGSMRPPDQITSVMVASGIHYQKMRRLPRPLVIINLSKQNINHTQSIRHINGKVVPSTKTHFQFDQINRPLHMNITGSDNIIFIDIVSGIPRDWFSMIMDHSTLPIVYEGANTANLAHQLGRPFLALRPDVTTPYVEIQGFEKGKERLEDASKALAGRNTEITNETPRIVANVLIELENPSSDVARYVAAVHERASSPEADQLLMAIHRLRETSEKI